MTAFVADANGTLRWNGGGVWQNGSNAIDIVGLMCTSGDIAEGSYIQVYGRG